MFNPTNRILVYGQIPPPYHGSNVMTSIFLKALNKIGYSAKLSQKMFSKDVTEVNRITPVKLFRLLFTLGRFLYNLIEYRPDLVVFFISATRIGIVVDGMFIFLTQIFNVPYVLYLHPRGHGDIYSNSLFFRKFILKIFKSAIACFVLGKIFQSEIQSFYKGKIYILPNCLEENSSVKKESITITKVLFLSNICESKGIFTFVKSIPFIISENKNIEFVIAGPWQDEKLKNIIFDFIKQNNLENFVKFVGPVYGKEKEDMFQSCDIFVFPTNYPLEALSLVILEAMQAGLPVIASNIGALPEVVLDGKTGFVIQPENSNVLAEKVKILIKNPSLRFQMGMESRERFLNYYSFEVYTKNLGTIMNEILI